MKENVNQSLSAMLDNESESFEVRRTLDQIDDESIATWSRYQAISSTLKGEAPASLDISGQVMAALEHEPELEIAKDRMGFLAKPVASVAIAASVTAMVIFGVQNYQGSEEPAQTVAQSDIRLPAQPVANSSIVPAQFGQLPAPQTPSLNQAEVIRLAEPVDKYIQRHQSMRSVAGKAWSASWLPKGFQLMSHDVSDNTEVLRFTNGQGVISIFVESNLRGQHNPGVVHSGDTVALSKKNGSELVTVVGEMPLLVADRIASSVQPIQ